MGVPQQGPQAGMVGLLHKRLSAHVEILQALPAARHKLQNYHRVNKMPETRSLIFNGKRLDGNKVCLFDSEPRDVEIAAYHHGVPDVCHKTIYPQLHDCRKLIPQGTEVTEFPMISVGGSMAYRWPAGETRLYDSEFEAFKGCFEGGPRWEVNPLFNQFHVTFQVNIGDDGHGKWYSGAIQSVQGLGVPRHLLNPAWLTDRGVDFSIKFNLNHPSNLPLWCRATFLDEHWGWNSGEQEVEIAKGGFYTDDYMVYLSCVPMPFPYGRLYSLPPLLNHDGYGLGEYYLSQFNPRLVVRQNSTGYKVTWPLEVIDKAYGAVVVDSRSGLPVGPPLIFD